MAKSNIVEVNFLKELGSYKKGAKVKYHISTANVLADKGFVEFNGYKKPEKIKE